MASPPSLERALGDPREHGAPAGHRATLTSDERRELPSDVEQALVDWGFGAELVPVSLGGRWRSTEDLVRRLLPIFRRDPAIGLGHGVTSLMAAVNVWTGGSEAQQQELAARLLSGARVAVAFHELDHGNDLLRNECVAVRENDAPAWRISGRKEVINNINRAESVLLFVRTAPAAGPKSFSLLLWHKDQALGGRARTDERVLTAGVRACQIGVAELDQLRIPADALVAGVGDGAAVALRAFQVTRAVVPALATGTVDAALRLAVQYLRGRHLYGSPAWELPHAQGTLARAWGTFLVADALARATVRALHLHPDECFVVTAASKYLVPTLINDVMHELSVLFGSTFYAVSDDYGVFEKWLRDLIVLPIGHAGSTACLVSIVPHLPSWARRSRKGTPYDSRLFSPHTELDEVDFSHFGLGAGHGDSFSAPLESDVVAAALAEAWPDLVPVLGRWRVELELVRDEVSCLSPQELAPGASPRAFALARRLTQLMAAGAVIGSWHEGRGVHSSPFHRHPSAFPLALHLLSESLPGGPSGRTGLDPDVWAGFDVGAMAAAVAAAVDSGFSLGIEELPLHWTTTIHAPTQGSREA
ncbi:acyl-CoA dehydrogenase family protein [Cellulomonas sp. URHD0024]|uniref:acyl-CoA dehydrogenase family protein n=1 Tax=Cellulomonas sp. URHD0024 TaxID=1302620 RepID=UPI000403A880|nr:acyl-CoA dehydrogenase family protein [Cellulomonas sp. URHD0024]